GTRLDRHPLSHSAAPAARQFDRRTSRPTVNRDHAPATIDHRERLWDRGARSRSAHRRFFSKKPKSNLDQKQPRLGATKPSASSKQFIQPVAARTGSYTVLRVSTLIVAVTSSIIRHTEEVT